MIISKDLLPYVNGIRDLIKIYVEQTLKTLCLIYNIPFNEKYWANYCTISTTSVKADNFTDTNNILISSKLFLFIGSILAQFNSEEDTFANIDSTTTNNLDINYIKDLIDFINRRCKDKAKVSIKTNEENQLVFHVLIYNKGQDIYFEPAEFSINPIYRDIKEYAINRITPVSMSILLGILNQFSLIESFEQSNKTKE